MQFAFTVYTPKGRIERGNIEAGSLQEAVALLKRQARVISVVPVRQSMFSVSAIRLRFGRVRMIERVLLAKHLALMLRAGLNIDRALGILAAQSAKYYMGHVLRQVLIAVQRGEALADVMTRFPRVFPPLFVTIVKWGEAGGTLPESLERLASQLQKDYELRAKVRGAMIYPAIVVGMTIIVGGVISVFVLPRMIKIFDSFELVLPISTRIFLFVAKFLISYGVIVVPAGLVVLVLVILLARSKFLRPFMHHLYLRLPIVGQIIREMNLARADRILGSLLRSGIPVLDCLEITADALGNFQYQASLREVRDQAQKGLAMGTILTQKRTLFPPIQSQMVAVGEETGRLDEVLLYLADFYEAAVEEKTKGLVQVLEPVLLVFVGLVVGGVALSVITPIYQLAGSFSR